MLHLKENRKNYITILIKTYIETLPPLAQLVRARGCRSISHTKVFTYEVLSADTVRSSAQIICSLWKKWDSERGD